MPTHRSPSPQHARSQQGPSQHARSQQGPSQQGRPEKPSPSAAPKAAETRAGATRAAATRAPETTTTIHPTAVVHPTAQLGLGVQVGPYTCIGAHVEIGDGCEVMSHVRLAGPTTLGRQNRLFPFASIGEDPQDKKYRGGSPSRLEIGDKNTFREFCSVHRGTPQSRGVTRIGNDNWIMAYAHIGHDTQIGSRTIISNAAGLGGHSIIHDDAVLGASVGIHQFTEIGEMAMIGAYSVVRQHVPPYAMILGHNPRLRGINRVGMRRNGIANPAILAVRRLYKRLFETELPLLQAVEAIDSTHLKYPAERQLLAFVKRLQTESERGFVSARPHPNQEN